ncbi:MAG TPA: hypothetical protein VD997_07925 [Phycisphaerales bacterium]|nr:hypothetical protein [Phycisphaerales bacterium]
MKAVVVLMVAAALLPLGACRHDDEVGHTKTTTKSSVQTPEGKKTITETRTKDTTIVPK